MKQNILLNKSFFTYDGENYLNEEFYRIQEKLKNGLRVIILEEELNIDHFDIKLKRNKISRFVDENIKKNLLQNGDVLYHYEYHVKKHSLYIYYIKGGKKISEFIEYIKELEVIPIQFFINSVLRNKFKVKDQVINALFKINNNYYYIIAEDKIIIKSFIGNNKEDLLKNININKENSNLYIDNSILNEVEEIEKDINLISFDITKVIYEQIKKK